MCSAPCKKTPFPSAHEDAKSARLHIDSPQCRSASYRLAYQDQDFLLRDELRPLRLQLELLKAELIQQEHRIESTVVIFGSARIPDPDTAHRMLAVAREECRQNMSNPNAAAKLKKAEKAVVQSRYYSAAQELGQLISRNSGKDKLVVVTGGGPGIMEAANRGAHDVGVQSIGMNIVLPYEQASNPFITPELSFQFHYFAIRKMHLLMRARSLVAFPGGFGTLDELFETLTLIQTRKVTPIPVLLFGKEFWDKVMNFEAMVEEGTIDCEDLALFEFVETAEEAWDRIAKASGLA